MKNQFKFALNFHFVYYFPYKGAAGIVNICFKKIFAFKFEKLVLLMLLFLIYLLSNLVISKNLKTL